MHTVVLLKPDAVENKLVGQMLSRFEQSFALVGLKIVTMDVPLCRRHYEEHVAKDFYPKLEEFMTSGPLVAVFVNGDVQAVRTLAKSLRAEFHPDYVSGPRNLIHASDGPESARREAVIWFSDVIEDLLLSGPEK